MTHAGVISQVIGVIRCRPASIWATDRPDPFTAAEIVWQSGGPAAINVSWCRLASGSQQPNECSQEATSSSGDPNRAPFVHAPLGPRVGGWCGKMSKARLHAALPARTVSDRIREKISELRRAMDQEAERRKKLLGRLRLYHFTDVRNVASIKEHGGIYSLDQCEALGIEIAAPGGDENSQDSDRANGMDKYVHLCLRGEHPMEYSAKAKGRIEKSIFIPINSDVLAIDGVRFVPGMSNKKGIADVPPRRCHTRWTL